MNYNLQTPSDKRTDILQVDWNDKGLPYIKDAIIFQLNHISEVTGRNYVATPQALEALGKFVHRQEPIYMELSQPTSEKFPPGTPRAEISRRVETIDTTNACAMLMNVRIVYETEAGTPLLPGPAIVADVHAVDLPSGKGFREALESGQDGFRAALRSIGEFLNQDYSGTGQRFSIHEIVTFDIISRDEDGMKMAEAERLKLESKTADAAGPSLLVATE